ncbi:hypothetical protein MTsPCn3_17840 [Erythrobacter sp. MTPC3]
MFTGEVEAERNVTLLNLHRVAKALKIDPSALLSLADF